MNEAAIRLYGHHGSPVNITHINVAVSLEMVADLPRNERLQKMLSPNGWKIRTCLLK